MTLGYMVIYILGTNLKPTFLLEQMCQFCGNFHKVNYQLMRSLHSTVSLLQAWTKQSDRHITVNKLYSLVSRSCYLDCVNAVHFHNVYY